jgi:DNA-binding NarL/FixJ family response regulator
VPKIRVLLADDHVALLTEVRKLLESEFDVVGTVNNGRDAVAEVQRLDPDVLVTDISMPILNGLQVASRLKLSHCRTQIVFLSIHEDQDFVGAAFFNGASAYVSKSHLSTDLIRAIREALEGQTYVSPSIPR